MLDRNPILQVAMDWSIGLNSDAVCLGTRSLGFFWLFYWLRRSVY
jgi:hypothetical protein